MRKMAAFTLLAVLLTATFSSAFAQSAVVTGTVVYRNAQPAVNCTVVLGGRFAFVDVRGRFRILNVPFGTYTLQVQRQGKTLRQIRVTINQAQVVLSRIIL
jgi:hypothetical protein